MGLNNLLEQISILVLSALPLQVGLEGTGVGPFVPPVVGAVTIVVLFVVGVLYAKSGILPPITITPVSADSKQCKELCDEWDQRRQDRCNAEKDEAAAKARVEALKSLWLAATILAAILFAAAYLLLSNPLTVGYGLYLLGLAIAALALAIFFAGELSAAVSDLSNKAGAAQAARQAEADARALMISKCPPDEVASCLARPSPC